MVSESSQIQTFPLTSNGFFPNNRLPVLLYKKAIQLPGETKDAAEKIKTVFEQHHWSNTWENGIYDYHHYHSNTHECLGIAAGKATLVIGGPNGKEIEISAGDVLILPAGTGHMCVTSSDNFLCVGAYPNGMDYDLKYGKETELTDAIKNLQLVPLPDRDPVYGSTEFLQKYWK